MEVLLLLMKYTGTNRIPYGQLLSPPSQFPHLFIISIFLDWTNKPGKYYGIITTGVPPIRVRYQRIIFPTLKTLMNCPMEVCLFLPICICPFQERRLHFPPV